MTMTTGERIMNLRQKAGMSQEAFGEKLGVSRQAIKDEVTSVINSKLPDTPQFILNLLR